MKDFQHDELNLLIDMGKAFGTLTLNDDKPDRITLGGGRRIKGRLAYLSLETELAGAEAARV